MPAETPSDEPGNRFAAIHVKSLTKQFGKQVTALDSVDLKVPQGEFFGLFGPNGAGKSTLLKILTGQLTPTRGEALVLGLDPVDASLEVRAAVGIVPEAESPPSFLTVEEVLEFVARLRGVEGAEDASPGAQVGTGEAAGSESRYRWGDEPVPAASPFRPAEELDPSSLIAHWIEYFELEDKAQTLCRHLSRGQRQKVMLAAAFLHRPPLLFLDEPFINLDPLIQRKLRGWLTEYVNGGGTVVMATHILEVAERLCTQVAIIDAGKVVASATKAELDSAGRGLEQAFYEAVGYTFEPEV